MVNIISVNYHPLDCSQKFPDGTYAIRLMGQLLLSVIEDVNLNRTTIIKWNYENEAEMSALFYVVNHIRELGANDIELYLPYIPNARMDRVKKHGEVFTLKYFACFINSLCFRNVHVLDPHSNVSIALIDRIVVDQPKSLIRKALSAIDREDVVSYFPDEGAVKRYAEMVKGPFIYGEKKRDWSTRQILDYRIVTDDVPDISGKPILMIDDICSRGSTFYYSAVALKKRGVGDIYIYCTHCEKTIFEGKLLEDSSLIKHIYTTDSIFPKPEEYSDLFTVFRW